VNALAVTFFRDRFATIKQEEQITLAALAERIGRTTRPEKAQLPWLKCAKFGEERTDDGSLRNNANLVAVTGIEADYDAEKISFEDAKRTLAGRSILALLYTSPSHTEAAPRWRVLCPLSQAYPPERRDVFMARLNGMLGGVFSLESWTLSQSYYFGSIEGNPSHRVVVLDGDWIDVREDLDLTAIGRPEKPKPNGANGQHDHLASRPEDILDARIRGLVGSLLDNVRNASDGTKHNTLRSNARTLGGYLHLTGWSQSEAVEQLVRALPASVKDWDSARKTAAYGVTEGMKARLDLEDRPSPRSEEQSPPQGLNDLADWEPPAKLPTIIVQAGKRHVAADAGLAALRNAKVPFYRREKELVRILRVQLKLSNGADVLLPAVVPLTMPMLIRALGRSAHWFKFSHKREQVSIDPPKAIAEQILGMTDEWPFPTLRGVVATQTMRYDGTLLIEPGYDPATGLVLFEPPPMPDVQKWPSKNDALEALSLLNGLLAEFVFPEDGNVSRSAAMSMIMTAVLRGAMPVAPMHVITKPEAGTGGSYLQDLVAAIATGERCPVISFVPDDDKENEKRMGAAALAQQPIIALDNLSSTLMGDFLCQLISQPVVQVRVLGRLDLVSLVNSAFVIANGNNLVIGADTVRRVVQISLDADMESPEARTFIRDPIAEVLADRGRYVGAVLTIARAHRVDGWQKLPRRAGFEAWSDIVRSALVWLGWPDPVQSVDKVRAEDPVRGGLNAVIAAWASELQVKIGYHSSELISLASEWSGTERVRPALWDALSAVAGGKGGQIDPAKLGLWLNKNLNRVIAGHKLLVDRDTNKARPRWLLVPR
jgi:hypothetical protein